MTNTVRALTIWAWVISITMILLVSCNNGDSDSQYTDGDSADGDSSQKECTEDSQCDPGEFCSQLGECLRSCRNDGDCLDSVCDRDSGQCVECVQDTHCFDLDQDAYCDTAFNKCRVGCIDCEANQVCVANRCVVSDEDGDISDGDEDTEEDEEIIVAVCKSPGVGIVCEAGCTECLNESTSRLCRDDGMGFDQILCDEGATCNLENGICEAPVCAPGNRECQGNISRICNADGSGWIENECVGAEECIEGLCQNVVCSQGFGALFYNFEQHSRLAAKDRHCLQELNRGSGAWVDTESERGWVASFDGQRSRMLVPSTSGNFTSGLSISLSLMLLGDASQTETIIAKGNPATYSLQIENGKPVARILVNSSEKFIAGNTLSRGEWHNLTVTFNGEELRLYVDGAREGNPVTFEDAVDIDSNFSDISIGAHMNSAGEPEKFLNGQIDNIFLSDKGINDDEVAYFVSEGEPCPLTDEDLINPADCSSLCQRAVLTVPAKYQWTSSSLMILDGEAIHLNPGGCVHPSLDSECIPADGGTGGICSTCPMPGKPRYVLIGKFGENGAPFFMGNEGIYVADHEAVLIGGYNDDDLQSNNGGFGILIERGYCDPRTCPPGMVLVPNMDVCIDRYEASCSNATEFIANCNPLAADTPISQPGYYPWTNITAEEAELACERIGKRICSLQEWTDACEGFSGNVYPYGSVHEDGRCNESSVEPPLPYIGLTSTGYLYSCISETGAFDMGGNAGEYVYVDTSDDYRIVSGLDVTPNQTCSSYTDSPTIPDYIGFRCCTDLSDK